MTQEYICRAQRRELSASQHAVNGLIVGILKFSEVLSGKIVAMYRRTQLVSE